jgi:two-component system phosphate regulon response regulator OmpR
MPDPQAPHVVLLDGSPLYAEVFGNLFASQGYRVTTLTDCAVEPAGMLGLVPALIILDLRCGVGLTGLDFLRRLRADPGGGDVPVLASTAASLIDMDRLGAELKALDAPIFDGFAQYDDLLAAARAATARPRERRGPAASDRGGMPG